MPRRSKNDAPPILSVNETAARYTGEWILMKVTEYDEHNIPDRGHIIAHSPSRARISRAFAKEPPFSELPPDTNYYIYQAYKREYSGDAWGRILDRIARDSDNDAPW